MKNYGKVYGYNGEEWQQSGQPDSLWEFKGLKQHSFCIQIHSTLQNANSSLTNKLYKTSFRQSLSTKVVNGKR